MSEIPAGVKCPNCGFFDDSYIEEAYHLKPGTLLNETYVIGRAIGQGGFGITYSGFDTLLNMKVAIKEFYLDSLSTRDVTLSNEVSTGTGSAKDEFEKYREKFIEEARKLAIFNKEEGIVSVHRYFKENNTAYIIMEYVDGGTLKDYVKLVKRLSLTETKDIMLQLLAAVEKIHSQNCIHRDISPDNIMLTKDKKVKILDFGSMREESKDGEKSLSVILKHGYAPMEQYSTHGKQGPWTDIYALCATAYYCLTGKKPLAVSDRAMKIPMESPRDINPLIPPSVDEVIMKGLEIAPEDRYQNISELGKAFTDALLTDETKNSNADNIPKSIHVENVNEVAEKFILEEQPAVTVFEPSPDVNAGRTRIIDYFDEQNKTGKDETVALFNEKTDDFVIEEKQQTINIEIPKKKKKGKKHIGIIVAVIILIMAGVGAALFFSGVLVTRVAPKPGEIKVWSYSEDLADVVKQYAKSHPEMGITVKSTVYPVDQYYKKLNEALLNPSSESPDIYAAESNYAYDYTKGYYSQFALPYKNMGINVNKEIKDSEIIPYIVEGGTDSKGRVVALSYQSAGCAFIYRRSYAVKAWGTDSPDKVAKIIGGGTGSWDSFTKAAQDATAKGYKIVYGIDAVWTAQRYSTNSPWVVNDKIIVDEQDEMMMDLARKLVGGRLVGKTNQWSSEWYDKMKADSDTIGFFGPVWLANMVWQQDDSIYGDWGVCEPPVYSFYGGPWIMGAKNSNNKGAVGEILKWMTLDSSDSGYQVLAANNKLKAVDSVPSQKVMKQATAVMPSFNEQNVQTVYTKVNENTKFDGLCHNDYMIDQVWRKYLKAYAAGQYTKEEAIEQFKKEAEKYIR